MTTTAFDAYPLAPADPVAWVAALGLKMTIGGEDAAPATVSQIVDPCRGQIGAAYDDADVGHVDAAVAAAKAVFPGWSATPWEERRAALHRFADLMLAQRDELGILVAIESGRPLWRAWNEVNFSVTYIRNIADAQLPPVLIERAGLRVTMKRKSLGVAAAIAPWNAPVILAVAKIANALLAGDTMLLRPSPYTPLSALYLGRMGRTCFPAGVFNVITGDASVGAAMTTHPDVAKVSFTGSTATGKAIAAAAAPTLKRLTLELGGNDAAIVLPDADIDLLAATLFQVSLGNAGHFCAAVKRLYVHEDVYGRVRDALAAQCEVAVLGTTFDPVVTMGPVQNKPQFDRIWGLYDDAVANGARTVTGGARWTGEGFFIPPTLVEGIGHGVALVDEEQFGPVLPLLPFSDENVALEMANLGNYGLGGSIWSADIDRACDLVERMEVGSGWVNQHGAYSAAIPMPFAKESGIGMDYAHYGVAEHMRAMVINARL